MTPHKLQPGAILINRYKIKGYIGEGGMQQVFLADDITLLREVVVKIPKDGVADRRFKRGAEMGARISHPNIAATLDYYESNELTFLVEEYVPGFDLGYRLEKHFEFCDPFLAAHVIHHIAKAIHEAHRVGICHRDLKPSNIMTSADYGMSVVKLTDFGIAKLAQNEIAAEIEEFNSDPSTLTSSNTLLGAVPYMAPECWENWRDAGKPMDIWAFGCVAYQILTGTPPFGTGRQSIMKVAKMVLDRQVVMKKPQWFGAHRSTDPVQKVLWSLIESCVRLDPADRPVSQTVVEACGALCYSIDSRKVGVVENYPTLYKNGQIGKFGFIKDDEGGPSLFFHGTEYYGPRKPSAGQRVSYSLYPGDPKPRVSPILMIRSN